MQRSLNHLLVLLLVLIRSALCVYSSEYLSTKDQVFQSHDEDFALAAIMLSKAEDELKNGCYKKGLEYVDLSIDASERAGYLEGIAHSVYMKGMLYRGMNEYVKALEQFNLSREHFNALGHTGGEAKALNLIGYIYRQQGNYPKAMEYLFTSQRLYQQSHDTIGLANVFNSIGVVYYYQKDYDKALVNYYQSLNLEIKTNSIFGECVSYLNIGEVYQAQGQYQEALEYYLKSLTLVKKHGKEDRSVGQSLGAIYNQVGELYMLMGDLERSQIHLELALEIFQEQDDQHSLAECLRNIGELAFRNGNTTKAILTLNQALGYAKIIASYDLLSRIHLALSQVFESRRNIGKAFHHYKQHIEARDYLFNEDNTKRIVEAELIHRFEKQLQEAKLDSAKREAIAQEIIHRQNIVRLFLGLVILLMVITLAITLHAYRVKKDANKSLSKQRNQIAQKNEELMQQQEEILAQRDEIEKQNSKLKLSRRIIEAKNERMVSSIEYAQSIQQAILPTEENLNTLLPEHMVLFMPKDIVSGDFYWASSIKDNIILAVLDCTGHGVPGAFMSLIGNTMLNQIVNEWQTLDPAQILKLLHEQIRKTLQQDKDHSRTHASMDVCLVNLNLKTRTCTFAGGSRPLYLVENGVLKKIPGNKRAVGGMQRTDETERTFKNNIVKLSKGCCLYLASDGYSDQMDKNTRKFGVKRFIKLLESIHNEPMHTQKEILMSTIAEHSKGYEQIDDICVLGIRL